MPADIYILVLELYCFDKRHVIVLIQQIKVGLATLVVSVMEAQRGDKVYNHTIIL